MTHASCKASAAVACSPSCAPTDASTNSNASTASPTAWEAAASLQLRRGDPAALDAYEAHGRIVAGTLDDHLARIAATWIDHHDTGRTLAVVASTNDHVDTINHAIQTARLAAGHLDPTMATRIAGGETAHVGDVVATRRNDRRLVTSHGEPVRNRDTWTVTAIHRDGSITVSHQAGHGDVTLPADYVRDHVRLGYAATEHGWQSDTVDTAIALTSPATTRRGLYVAATRGRDTNTLCVVTDSDDIAEARDVLEAVLAADRADVPATTQRRTLAQTVHQPAATPIRRCEVPAWFPTVLAEAQRRPRRRRSSRQPPPRLDEPKRPPRSLRRTRRWPTSQRRPLMTATPCVPQKPAPSRLDATTPAHSVVLRPRHAANDAPPATTSTSPSDDSNGSRTTSPAPGNEPGPPSNATRRPSPLSATPARSCGRARRSTGSTP